MNWQSTFKYLILYQLSDNYSFQSHLKPIRRYASCQLSELTTVGFRAICSFHFLHLSVCHTVSYTMHPDMRVHDTVRNVVPPHLTFSFSSGSATFFTLNQSTSRVDNRSFQSYQNPVNSES